MRTIKTITLQRHLQHALSPMLRAFGAERSSEQRAGGKTACSNCSISKCAEQRGNFAVRQPDADETPLSEAERLIAVREFAL